MDRSAIGGGCKRSINFEGVFGVDCGNIVIESGTVTATGMAAGIGSGYKGTCGAITISSGLTSLTSTMGYEAEAPIGSGNEGSCGTVTIDESTTWTAGRATEHYTWTVSTVKDLYVDSDGTRWTLTRK